MENLVLHVSYCYSVCSSSCFLCNVVLIVSAQYTKLILWTVWTEYVCVAQQAASVGVFYSILDQTSCSFFRKPGSGGPRRLVKVALLYIFSTLLLLVRASVCCQMTTCAVLRGIPILSYPHTNDSSFFIQLWSLTRVLFFLYTLLFHPS